MAKWRLQSPRVYFKGLLTGDGQPILARQEVGEAVSAFWGGEFGTVHDGRMLRPSGSWRLCPTCPARRIGGFVTMASRRRQQGSPPHLGRAACLTWLLLGLDVVFEVLHAVCRHSGIRDLAMVGACYIIPKKKSRELVTLSSAASAVCDTHRGQH